MTDLIKRAYAMEILDDFQETVENGANAYSFYREKMQKLTSVNPFEIVLDALTDCDMFRGIYDAKNGDKQFMFGIATVMETIAYRVSDADGEMYENEFMHNITESQRKAGLIDDD